MSNRCATFRSVHLIILMFSLGAGPAVASIGRTQTFDIGAVNRILWTGGVGSAQGQTQIHFNQTQQAGERSRYNSLSATQTQRGTLTQTATSSGAAPSTARQAATIKGTQDLLGQNAPSPGNRAKQDLEVTLNSRLSQPSGIGTVTGTQTFRGLQEQALTSSCGTGSQSQSVAVLQSGKIATEADVDPIVTNRITIGMHQSQVTNGPQW